MLEIVGGSGTTIAVTSARTQTFTFPNYEGVPVTYALTATTAGAAETVAGWKIDNGVLDQRSGAGNLPGATSLVVQPGMSAKVEITSSYTLASGYKVATKLMKGVYSYTALTVPYSGTVYGVGETHVYGPTAKTANKHFDMRPPQGVNLVDVLAALFNLSNPAEAALFLDNIENNTLTFRPTLP